MSESPTNVITDFGNVHAAFDKLKACEKLARHSSLSAQEIHDKIVGSVDEKLLESGSISEQEFATRVIKTIHATGLTTDECLKIWGDIFTETPGFHALVQDLKARGIRMALLSNTNAVHWPFMQQMPSVKLMQASGDPMILSHVVGSTKPDDKIYHASLKMLGCTPAQAAYIDDLPQYAEKAEQLGMKGIVFDCTKQPIGELRKQLGDLKIL